MQPYDPAGVDDMPLRRGLEKILAAAPAYTLRSSSSADADLDRRLTGMHDDIAGCRSYTWSQVYRHSGSPSSYTARPCTDSCRRRGCPTCGRDHLVRETAKHRDRIEDTFADGIAQVRLSAPLSAGPADLFADFARWRRRRTVTLPPGLGLFHPDRDGRYGLTLLVPADADGLDRLGGSWTSATGGEWSTEILEATVDPFDHIVDTRTAAEAAILELVDEGVVEPETARRWLIEEHKKKRFRFIGGFLGADSSDDDQILPDRELDEPEPDQSESLDARPATRSVTELLDNVTALAESGPQPYRHHQYEDQLRAIERQAADLGDPTSVLEAVEAALDRLPDSYFNCTEHRQCRSIPTPERIRTRHLDDQVTYGRVEYHDDPGEYRWSDESWPWWSRHAEKLHA
jgi:hypothetical protein